MCGWGGRVGGSEKYLRSRGRWAWCERRWSVCWPPWAGGKPPSWTWIDCCTETRHLQGARGKRNICQCSMSASRTRETEKKLIISIKLPSNIGFTLFIVLFSKPLPFVFLSDQSFSSSDQVIKFKILHTFKPKVLSSCFCFFLPHIYVFIAIDFYHNYWSSCTVQFSFFATIELQFSPLWDQ